MPRNEWGVFGNDHTEDMLEGPFGTESEAGQAAAKLVAELFADELARGETISDTEIAVELICPEHERVAASTCHICTHEE